MTLASTEGASTAANPRARGPKKLRRSAGGTSRLAPVANRAWARPRSRRGCGRTRSAGRTRVCRPASPAPAPRGGRRALRARDRGDGAGVRRGQAPGRLLRATRGRGMERPGRDRGARARPRPAGDRRRQAGRRRRHRGGVRAGVPRRDAEPVRPDPGPRRGRDDGQPAARPGLARAVRDHRPRPRPRAVRARAHVEPRRRGRTGARARRRVRRERAPRRPGGGHRGRRRRARRACPTSARSSAPPRPSGSPRCAIACRTRFSCCPGLGPRAETSRTLRPRSRAGRRAG